jgi:hypothetical protein
MPEGAASSCGRGGGAAVPLHSDVADISANLSLTAADTFLFVEDSAMSRCTQQTPAQTAELTMGHANQERSQAGSAAMELPEAKSLVKRAGVVRRLPRCSSAHFSGEGR